MSQSEEKRRINDTENDPALERAEVHVKLVRDFFYHLMTYVFVGVLLVVIDLSVDTGGNTVLGLDWAYWVILFWGLGVVGQRHLGLPSETAELRSWPTSIDDRSLHTTEPPRTRASHI